MFLLSAYFYSLTALKYMCMYNMFGLEARVCKGNMYRFSPVYTPFRGAFKKKMKQNLIVAALASIPLTA
jgi:hypothetical protein